MELDRIVEWFQGGSLVICRGSSGTVVEFDKSGMAISVKKPQKPNHYAVPGLYFMTTKWLRSLKP
jgi:dTDP-glucose pyrophosphorylase